MRTPAIVPTITQRVRSFLSQQGAALRPWTGLQETYDELYALLSRRRGDSEFWRPLKVLLQEVVDSAADSQRRGRPISRDAELLASWQVDALVDELREALPMGANGGWCTRTEFTRGLSSAVLGGFLLLGLAAAGCGSNSNAGEPAGTGGAGGQVVAVGGAGGAGAGGTVSGIGGAGGVGLGGAGSGGIGGSGGAGLGGSGGLGSGGVGSGGVGGVTVDSGAVDAAALDGSAPACSQTVDPELDRAIGESTLGASQKSQLCQCFSALTTSWTTSLTQLFATATPEQISTMLSGLTSCCHSDGMATLHGTNADPSSTDLGRIQSGSGYLICSAVVYKGVSFPD